MPTHCGIMRAARAADLWYSVVEGSCFFLRNILKAYVDMGQKVICSSGGLNQLGVEKLRASLYGEPVRLVPGADPTSFATVAISLHSIGELNDPRDAMAWLDFEPKAEWEATGKARSTSGFSVFAQYTQELVARRLSLRRKT